MFELFHVKVPGYHAPEPMPLGRLLFDTGGNWIYDGEALAKPWPPPLLWLSVGFYPS